MKISIFPSFWFRHGVTTVLAVSIFSLAAIPQAEAGPAFDPGIGGEANARVIVKLKKDAPLSRKHVLSATASASETVSAVNARVNALGLRLGLPLQAGRALNEQTHVVRAAGMGSTDLAQRLAAEADVEYAEVDRRRKHFALPNDPLYSHGLAIRGSSGGPSVGQWYLQAPAGEVMSSINATGAWDLTTGSAKIVVAVLDTGVRPEHPDLASRVLPGYDMISDAPTANDGNGRESDATDPGDWVTSSESGDLSSPFSECGAENSSWHGTMTASLIGAASNNGIGMAGVAWGVKLLPVRVLGKCGGYDSDIIAGISWAAGMAVPGLPVNPNPARVINMSLGGNDACSQSYRDAINAVSTRQNPAVIVAAAGNSTGHAVGAPANCPGVISVAGLRHIGTKVGFSDLGPEISISAPGGNCVNTNEAMPCLYPILAATNTGTTTPLASSYTDSFNYSVGTSFSAPLVAGTAALMLSGNSSLSPSQIRAALQSTARPFPSSGANDAAQTDVIPICRAPDSTDQTQCYCTTSTCGAGMLDSASAVAAVMITGSVVEFYNTRLDNYFVTADANEAVAIDQGSAGPSWVRTGNSFKSGGSAKVCRFYGSLSPGPNSHFFTIDPGECAALKQLQTITPANQKRWNFESLNFDSTRPTGGVCPGWTVPVYRAYNNGFARGVDSNHRLSSSPAAIQEVVSRGWANEGVVMCALI